MANDSSTRTTNVMDHTDEQTDFQYILFLVVSTITGVIIVFGNILIICAVWRFKMLKSANHVMIVSLAIGDLTVGLLFIPLKLFLTHNPFLGKYPCLLNITVTFFSIGLAIAALSMLSVERFYAIQFPFHYHSHMTVTRSMIWSAITFVTVFFLAIPIPCGIDVWTPDKQCFSFIVLPDYYIWTVCCVMFVILLCGFVAFVRVLVAEINIRRRHSAWNMSDARKSDSVKCTLMLMVYVFSLVCYIPIIVYTIISALYPRYTYNKIHVTRTIALVALFSSGLNCFIYGFKNSQIREAFKNMLCCKILHTLSYIASSSNVTLGTAAHSVDGFDVACSAVCVPVSIATNVDDLNFNTVPQNTNVDDLNFVALPQNTSVSASNLTVVPQNTSVDDLNITIVPQTTNASDLNLPIVPHNISVDDLNLVALPQNTRVLDSNLTVVPQNTSVSDLN